jgi:hypothetical protein
LGKREIRVNFMIDREYLARKHQEEKERGELRWEREILRVTRLRSEMRWEDLGKEVVN